MVFLQMWVTSTVRAPKFPDPRVNDTPGLQQIRHLRPRLDRFVGRCGIHGPYRFYGWR